MIKEAELLADQLRVMDERHDAELHEMEERHQHALAAAGALFFCDVFVAKRLLGRSFCLL